MPFYEREGNNTATLFFCYHTLAYEEDQVLKESDFQKSLINELKRMLDGCYIFKLDPSRYQGIPDLLILWKNKWATLECKTTKGASKRPNQDYHVEAMNKMSFSSYICPENKEEVLNDLRKAFGVKR